MIFSFRRMTKSFFLLFVALLCLTFIEADSKLHKQVNYQFDKQVDNVNKMLKSIDQKQLACMAKNIFFEAGRESDIGKIAVGLVVLNRVKHGFASTPCGVIYQTTLVEKEDELVKVCQFSWVCEGRDTPHKSNPSYKEAERIAMELLIGLHTGIIPNNTLFFHSATVDPNWPYHKVSVIGNHIFYSKTKKAKK